MARVPRAVSARARGPPRDTSPPSPPFPGSRATRGRAEAAGAMFWLVALVLLGIERFLYGYIYHYPNSFKRLCRGPLKALLDYDEGVYWQVANHLGIVIKVFQFGVVAYDIMPPALNFARPVQLCVAAVLIGIGQLLNAAVFRREGPSGRWASTTAPSSATRYPGARRSPTTRGYQTRSIGVWCFSCGACTWASSRLGIFSVRLTQCLGWKHFGT
ncbi:unnamed protein product [Prorocentrum cordatum]|uniref:Uncharacterized protein n=1 Tax=Prorocentrum cordatum TaxID=2364126 RepID=A0ABN9S089_9DINO|nr:unnamed protein product [Polarella glacialis]